MPKFNLYPGEQVIDDGVDNIPTPDGLSTGYQGMFSSPESAATYSALSSSFMVPRSEWQGRCEEMAESKTLVSDLIVQAGLKPKNQLKTNYCWIFAPTGAIETQRLIQGQKYISLSPASAGAQIKNYRNVGGWGEEGLQWIADHGLVPTEYWPDTAIDRRYATSENKTRAMEFRATEWDRLKPKSIDEMMSCLFHRKVVPIGLNWMGHEMYAIDPVWRNGAIGIRVRNSWGDIPDWPNGFGILQGNKMIPDDAVCLRSTTAS